MEIYKLKIDSTICLKSVPVTKITYLKIYALITGPYYRNLIGAYIKLGAANLLVICLAYHIITINSTNPLHICPIVISIRLHGCGTHFLRLVDVRLLWVRFVLI